MTRIRQMASKDQDLSKKGCTDGTGVVSGSH